MLQANGPEGAYHVLDWRSLKTPRVARSSLGAEAQSDGQACDALEHASIYWSLLVDPRQRLKELLDAPSLLLPTISYDSYHRKGVGSSVVDKRVSLEIRVMKDRLTSLGGSLRWMSSERQLADGLTKESARALLAQRLRHGHLKLVWDASYKAAKKKTKAELQQSLAESIQVPTQPVLAEEHHPPEEHLEPIDEHLPENEVFVDEQVFWNEEICRNALFPENVRLARTDLKLKYVPHSPSHVESRMVEPATGRMPNVMFWCLLLFMAPQLASATHAESEAGAGMD